MKLTIILALIHVVISHELTVRSSDLKLCGNRPVCVTNQEDCHPLPDSLDSPMQVNLTCFYEQSGRHLGQVSCDWSPAAPGSSLLFNSSTSLVSCEGLLWSLGEVQVTVRVHNQRTGVVRWSVPHTFKLSLIVRGSRPVVRLSGISSASMALSWTPRHSGRCWVRYSPEAVPRAPQEDQVRVEAERQVDHTLFGLLPSTRYTAEVACMPDSGFLSQWSEEVKGHTLERAPSTAPDVCYRLERKRRGPASLLLLSLTWKELDAREAGGRIQGYQVSYCSSTNGTQATVNVTWPAAPLEVREGSCRVNVTAFNSVGFGPTRTLDVEPLRPLPLPRHLWAFSLYPDNAGFLVQWEMDSVPHAPTTTWGPPANQGEWSRSPPVGQFAVEWRTEGADSVRGWTRVDTTSTVIQGNLDLKQTYSISVRPVHGTQCGPARSLTASLQHGALLEVVDLRAVGNTTSVTVQWAWQRKTEPIRVERYKVVLRCHCDSEDQALLLFPDQSQHTFENLPPNQKYSLLLLADNTTRVSHVFSTTLYVSKAALVSPLILLVVTMLLCCLSRAVYKHYFTLRICSPRKSSTGLWLMETRQQVLVRNILNMEDFLVTDFLGDSCPMEVSPSVCKASQRTIRHQADLAWLPSCQEYVTTADIRATAPSVYANDSVLCQSPDYVVNSPVAVEALFERMQQLVQPPHHHGHCLFPEEAEMTSELGSFQTLEVFSLCLGEGLGLSAAPLIVCEGDYVLSSNFTQTSLPASSCVRVIGAEAQ